jgi:hypothetical protein
VIDDATGQPLAEAKRLARVAKLKFAEEKVSDHLGPDLAAREVTGGDIRRENNRTSADSRFRSSQRFAWQAVRHFLQRRSDDCH